MHKRILLAVVVMALLAASGLFYANSPTPEPTKRRRQEPVRQGGRLAEIANAKIIQGQVFNAEGQLVAGVKVCANRDDALRGRALCERSDDAGNFRLEVTEPGTYSVYGSKEEDGYPLTISGFHREEGIPVPKVHVEGDQKVYDVILPLGPKASKVEGVITDAVDHQPVSKVTITLRRADNPDVYYMIGAAEPKENGRFKVLVPSVPFTIEVSSAEYETWTYSKNGLNNRSDPLTVNRGQSKNLNIALRPKRQL